MTDDLDRIMAVMEAAFDPAWGEAWTRLQVSDLLSLSGASGLLAGPGGEAPDVADPVVGFALTRRVLDEEELLLLAVLPQWRGRGVGRRLLARFIEAAKLRGSRRLFLEMREGNDAQALYLEAGFAIVGRRHDYYRRGHAGPRDALTFALDC